MSKKLLFSVTKKDLEVQTFRAGGKGGQHQNKTSSGVRIIHKASGAVGESRTERSQLLNKKLALQRLANSKKFNVWVSRMVFELDEGKTIEQMVEEAMAEKNLKIEVRNLKGRWEEDKK